MANNNTPNQEKLTNLTSTSVLRAYGVITRVDERHNFTRSQARFELNRPSFLEDTNEAVVEPNLSINRDIRAYRYAPVNIKNEEGLLTPDNTIQSEEISKYAISNMGEFVDKLEENKDTYILITQKNKSCKIYLKASSYPHLLGVPSASTMTDQRYKTIISNNIDKNGINNSNILQRLVDLFKNSDFNQELLESTLKDLSNNPNITFTDNINKMGYKVAAFDKLQENLLVNSTNPYEACMSQSVITYEATDAGNKKYLLHIIEISGTDAYVGVVSVLNENEYIPCSLISLNREDVRNTLDLEYKNFSQISRHFKTNIVQIKDIDSVEDQKNARSIRDANNLGTTVSESNLHYKSFSGEDIYVEEAKQNEQQISRTKIISLRDKLFESLFKNVNQNTHENKKEQLILKHIIPLMLISDSKYEDFLDNMLIILRNVENMDKETLRRILEIYKINKEELDNMLIPNNGFDADNSFNYSCSIADDDEIEVIVQFNVKIGKYKKEFGISHKKPKEQFNFIYKKFNEEINKIYNSITSDDLLELDSNENIKAYIITIKNLIELTKKIGTLITVTNKECLDKSLKLQKANHNKIQA